MKKIILLLSVFFLSAPALQAQDQPWRYHPLSEFQGDTIRFLETNFCSKYFWGKSVTDVIEILDREMPVKQIMYITFPEPYDGSFQALELIFDDREQYETLNQLHFFLREFKHEGFYHLVSDVEALLGFGPDQIVALTPDLRKRLKYLVFVDGASTNFTSAKFKWPQ